jgi:hypothetical protein
VYGYRVLAAEKDMYDSILNLPCVRMKRRQRGYLREGQITRCVPKVKSTVEAQVALVKYRADEIKLAQHWRALTIGKRRERYMRR